MSKKKLYLIIGITVIVTIGFFLAAYIISQEDGGGIVPENPITKFFPFGNPPENVPVTAVNNSANDLKGNVNIVNGGENTIDQGRLPLLRQLSLTATSGMHPFMRSGKTVVQFVERATGNIYETTFENMKKERISNSLIPGTYETYWGNNEKSIIYRYFNEDNFSITTFIRDVSTPEKLKGETKNDTPSAPVVDGSFLPGGVQSVFVSPDTKSMFYLVKTIGGEAKTTGNIFNFTKKTATEVFESPFSEWLPLSFDGKTAMLQTKPSQGISGFLYSFDVSTGNMQKILGDIQGLTTLPSPDLQKILYSESTQSGIILHLYDRKTREVLDISLSTLPEKCVWGKDSMNIYCAAPDRMPRALYPDDWYQGAITFSDAMWKINAKTGNVGILFLPSSFGKSELDMTNFVLSPNENSLFFINKKDSTLWGYDLSF